MSSTVSPRWERLSGFFVLFKQCFLAPHHMSSSSLGPLQASGWALLMFVSAITKGKLFVQFTQVQAGSTSAIQAFRKADFWMGRRAMLLVILKTALAAVVQEFAAGRLKILWRKVAAANAIRGYLDRNNTFYQLKLSGTVENPDARITADVAAIVDYSVQLTICLSCALTVCCALAGRSEQSTSRTPVEVRRADWCDVECIAYCMPPAVALRARWHAAHPQWV